MGRRSASAHIIAFVASGGCCLQPGAAPGLAARLGSARLDLVSLAPGSELGSPAVEAALQLVQLLAAAPAARVAAPQHAPCEGASWPLGERNSTLSCSPRVGRRGGDAEAAPAAASSSSKQRGRSREAGGGEQGGAGQEAPPRRASQRHRGAPAAQARLIWLEPPAQEAAEPWQQLEPLLERLEAPDLARLARSPQRARRAAAQQQRQGAAQREGGQNRLLAPAQQRGLILEGAARMRSSAASDVPGLVLGMHCPGGVAAAAAHQAQRRQPRKVGALSMLCWVS